MANREHAHKIKCLLHYIVQEKDMLSVSTYYSNFDNSRCKSNNADQLVHLRYWHCFRQNQNWTLTNMLVICIISYHTNLKKELTISPIFHICLILIVRQPYVPIPMNDIRSNRFFPLPNRMWPHRKKADLLFLALYLTPPFRSSEYR